MKELKLIFKFSAFILLVIFAVSCKKDSEPAYSAEKEAAQISDWIQAMVDKSKNVDTIATNIYYIIDKVGTGDSITTGDTVTVKYSGFFTDGTVFDASAYHGDGTYTFVHKDTDISKRMIQGWEEGIEVLNKGASAAFLIPSAKGYGSAGNRSIPPYTPLIFVIEVVAIK